ncbi:MAG TPA: hypothetical protein PKD55_02515 [Bellilinea sp.]|nr:hypothetical protein [Bellilinea sp.]
MSTDKKYAERQKRRIQKKKREQFESDLKLLNSLERQYMREVKDARNLDERLDALARLEWVQKRRRALTPPNGGLNGPKEDGHKRQRAD